MKIWSDNFNNGDPIPPQFALGEYDAQSHVHFAPNHNPHLAWSEAPEGTQSFVLIFHDETVPTKPDDVNQEDRLVPADLPRTDFYHWTLIDIPSNTQGLAAGSHSQELTKGGKSGPQAPGGLRHGLNNYTQWFAGDSDMQGQYYGYDGPCPPWNDSLIHHYHFTLYALDIKNLPVEGSFDAAQALKAMEGHILGQAKLSCTYTINPEAK